MSGMVFPEISKSAAKIAVATQNFLSVAVQLGNLTV